MADTRKRQFLSFFSGALGLDLGLERAGLRPIAANEIDPVACETIRLNRPDLRLYDCDVRQLTPQLLMDELSLKPGELFLLCGGPPCQAFSTAGKRLGLNDDRGNVFLHFIDLVGALRPKYFVIENVRGILSAPLSHRPHDQRGPGHPPLAPEEQPGGALRHILSLLIGQGYSVSFNLYNTANFGVPQVRERVVIIGAREGGKVPHLRPTHTQDGRFGLPRWKTFAEAVAGVEGPHEHLKYSEKRLQLFRLLKPGQNWRDLPPELHREALGRAFEAGGGKVGFCRRVAWDKPAPTVVTSPTMPATDLAHPTEERPLSVREYARVQTFPDDWVFAGSVADRYRQIGNAVPVVFGEAIGRHLLAFDDGALTDTQVDVTPLSRYRNTDEDSWAKAQQEVRRQRPQLQSALF